MSSRKFSLKRQESLTAYYFIAPFLIGVAIFGFAPIMYTFYISFMDMNGLKDFSSIKFVGFDNYVNVLQNKDAMDAFRRTFIFAIFEVPAMIVGSFLLAAAMNKKFFFRGAIRTVLLLPYVSVVSAIAIAWQVILSPYGGPINEFLKLVGVDNPPLWLQDYKLALPITALVYVYMNLAFQSIVFLAALQSVPHELYEAAELDGASRWQQMKNVTLPLISPTTFFITIASIMGASQTYGLISALTKGGPAGSTEVISYNIVKQAFQFNQYSFATAQSVILFSILALITILQWKGQKKWVHY